MGNTLNFLIEYSEYIRNIDNRSNLDDYIYNEITKRSKNDKLILSEGLITTYPSEKSVDILKRRFPELSIEIKEDGELFVENPTTHKLGRYIPLITNLGYFIASICLDGKKWTKEFNDDTMFFYIVLEAKYDRQVDIPEVLYHVSPIKYKEKITKRGISPRTGNKISVHPERVYLTDSLNTVEYFGRYLIENSTDSNEDKGYCVYSVNPKSISKLYSDVNMRNNGYYTFDYIGPDNIELISEVMEYDLD